MKSAILIRMSAIGDVLIALRAARILKENDVEPLFITSPSLLPVLRVSPYITWAATHEKEAKLNCYRKEMGAFVAVDPKQVRAHFHDFSETRILDLQVTRRSRRVLKALKEQFPLCSQRKTRVSKRSFFRLWLICLSFLRSFLFKQRASPRALRITSIHSLQEKALQKAFPGLKKPQFHTWCELPAVDLPQVPKVQLALCPGASGPLKRWPKERFRALKEAYLVAHPGARVGVIGGPDDAFAGEYIAFPKAESTFNLCGKLDILASIVVLARSQLIVTNDSFGAHVADAFGIRAYVIFGGTSPEFGFPPLGDQVTLKYQQLACSPCTRHGKGKCRFKNIRCLDFEIDVKSEF